MSLDKLVENWQSLSVAPQSHENQGFIAKAYGVVFLSHQIGSFSGVWLGGYLYSRFGSYLGIWLAGMVLGLVAAGLHWPIREHDASHVLASVEAAPTS